MNNCVLDEVEKLKQTYPDENKLHVTSATKDFLSAWYQRTKYTRIRLMITFPDGYPTGSHLIVNINTADGIVGPGLKRKLERELESVAKEAMKDGKKQLLPVFAKLVLFIEENKMLPCWKELKQSIDFVTSTSPKNKILVNEKKGKISLYLQEENPTSSSNGKIKDYFYKCSIHVDDYYPNTSSAETYGQPCKLVMEKTNFPPKIERLLTEQARDLVRKLQDGMNAEQALTKSNPIRAPKGWISKEDKEVKVRLTQSTLKDLKKDRELLKDVSDLRQINEETVVGNATIKAHSSKERKDARRMIKKVTEKEIEKDTLKDKQETEWQINEKRRMREYDEGFHTEYDGRNPQPSLFVLISFLIEKIHKLPEEKCPVCETPCLPKDPDELSCLYAPSSSNKSSQTKLQKSKKSKAKEKRPVRTFCGCWYHYRCLDKFMTEPPFGLKCLSPGCGKRVYHPDWPSDIKLLESTWARKQAREREIADVAMFL